MGRYTQKTTITKEEAIQLEGLRVLAAKAVDRINDLARAVMDIIGEEGDLGMGHAGDFIYSGYPVKELLEKSEITIAE